MDTDQSDLWSKDRLRDTALLREAAFIAGTWVTQPSGHSIRVCDPATGQIVGQVPALGPAQAAAATDAAQAAFAGWSGLLPQDRSAVLRRWFDLILAHKEDLAQIMVAEQGKPISEARGEIDYAASFVEFYAEESKRPNVESITSHLEGGEVEVWREPVGVAALITPWNFPSAMLTRKAAAALAAGCTLVAHPSAETPFSALALAVLAERAGLPAGVLNIVTGAAPKIVPTWTRDPRVRALSFTGSTEIGKLLMRQSAETVKTLVLELGGHAPFLVFEDADLDHVIPHAVAAKFATSGQDCLGANRFFVHEALYDQFCARFAQASAALRVGPGFRDPDIGPLMNAAAVDKQAQQVADTLAKGGRLLTGGHGHSAGPLFFEPTVLADVPPDARIMQEETFGPVAAVTPFGSESEVLARANATEYGLVAYLHTRDPDRIFRLCRALEFGMVAVNRTKITGAPVPFGGSKQSGLGREGARHGMEAFTDLKYVCRNWT
jgi:aspartate-semialdehyde dehydrogenase